MLTSISPIHDQHYVQHEAHSLASLATARADSAKHLLLCASGSVATIKLPEIIKSLSRYEGQLKIRIIMTQSAQQFLAGQSAEQPTVSEVLHLPNVEAIYKDSDEWTPSWKRGSTILHIELRRWADLLVVAPLSANTLAKVVNGMSDSLLTSVIRAWDTDGGIDGKKKLIAVAPAMNSAMWRHPITAKQIKVLTDDWGVKEDGEAVTVPSDGGETAQAVPDLERAGGWFQVIMPISKTLACGDTGDGAMASVETICSVIEARLGLS